MYWFVWQSGSTIIQYLYYFHQGDYVVVCLSVCSFVCVCNNYQSNEYIFLIFLIWLGPDQSKDIFNFWERSGSGSGLKKS